MKSLKINFTLFLVLFLFTSLSFAQTHMNHSKKDSNKMMMKHNMMSDSTQGYQNMMNDSTKMNHKNMKHEMMDHHSKQAANKDIWNAYCPIRGGEVDPETPTVKYKGKTIGFCCPGCDEKFMKDPEKYMKNLSEDGWKFIGKK